ncbi:MAG: NADH-quinone oxidoreductase subunit C [Actinomycetia bacterium]|nr:NADH-quinone oxidoreductase subunit C [Actinomycetes bacterium]
MSEDVAKGVAERSEPEAETAAVAGAEVEKSTDEAIGVDWAIGTQRRGMFGVSGSGDTTGFAGLVREPWSPPTAQHPFGGYFDEVVDGLAAAYERFQVAVRQIVVDRGELTLHVGRDHLLALARTLRDDPALRFELCSSVSGADYPDTARRLHAVYHLRSMTYRRSIRLEVAVSETDPHVPSVTAVYPTADWQEREAYDMFGIIFDGHPALTRIMMPDDWDGHPQRKDYPLGGIPVQFRDASIPPPNERRAYH